jgi:hypothetical protein
MVSGLSIMPARSIAAAGLLSLLFIVPATAQTTGPAESGIERNDQSARTAPASPAQRNTQPLPEPKTAPPARADDDLDAPPAGCRYRENKLDLIV